MHIHIYMCVGCSIILFYGASMDFHSSKTRLATKNTVVYSITFSSDFGLQQMNFRLTSKRLQYWITTKTEQY